LEQPNAGAERRSGQRKLRSGSMLDPGDTEPDISEDDQPDEV
jgi:hypothetical protein